jgi:hypothetical protein
VRKLIEVLTNQVLGQIKQNKANIMRIECFDDPRIYRAVCEIISASDEVDVFVGKLAHEKYLEFVNAGRHDWAQALLYLHKGRNEYYDEALSTEYIDKSFVDFNNAITKWRNEIASISSFRTSLILLMGTEAATDTGGLADTSFVISPKEVIAQFRNNYSSWFNGILNNNGIDSKLARDAIHTLYRAIFANVNIDLFKMSAFIDQIEEEHFGSVQEVINYICETLSENWSIPSIRDTRKTPRYQNLAKGSLSAAAIVSNAVRFIDRADDIPSERKISTYKEQFSRYAEEHTIDELKPFLTGDAQFESFNDFRDCVIDFMLGKDIDNNRAALLKVDYAIVADILKTKIPKPVLEKKKAVAGEPVEALSKMFLESANEFSARFKIFPLHYRLSVDRITLSNCVDDQKEDAFIPLACYLGGILNFFNDANIEHEGNLVSFEYGNGDGIDPFDYDNYSEIKSLIKCTGKWGDPCKVQFTITLSNGECERDYDYRWAFSPYSAWPNAFHYLANVLYRQGDSYLLPTLVSCDNIQDYLGCESEDEFYSHLIQLRDTVLFDEHRREIHKYFQGTEASSDFDLVCSLFKTFALKLSQHGLFNALEDLRAVVQAFSDMMKHISENYDQFTDIQREKVSLLLNCFVITSNDKVIQNGSMNEVIVPAYNPVMLEKMDAKQLFIRAGFAELFLRETLDSSKASNDADVSTFVQLAAITQGVDSVLSKASTFITCKNNWEYFGVYYGAETEGELLSGNTFGLSIVTDDEDASAMLRATPMSNIIVRNVLDYIKTFPARVDGVNIAFIGPTDMQHIVSAVHSIAKYLDDNGTAATINIKLICINSKKNSAAYLRKWLDSYFSEEKSVKVNTYLRNLTIRDSNDVDEFNLLLKDFDVCFSYNVLASTGVQFASTNDVEVDRDQPKFPMTFTPDTIASTHGKSRKVNISQFQFIASKYQTQASHIAGFPDSKKGIYRVFNTLELSSIQEQIIEIAHRCCKWVVCIDPAIDRKMLETHNSKIIGFTTGEGSYGELNVTVSARRDVLKDIKLMLKKRISEKFKNWSPIRLQSAADYCVDVLSQYMDGSRILKALNPYDYEIHNFLAYILTLQMLRLTVEDDSKVVRVLISLDSYKHWFVDDKDNTRPDFMLLEIPKSSENMDPEKPLQIEIKIIECKMGYTNDAHLAKAKLQLEKGLKTMARNWDPNDTGIMHRYWLNQLYRAIIFSPLNLSNTSPEYSIIREKIYNILNGCIDINWSGDVFAFWLDSDAEDPDEYPIESDVLGELAREGITVSELNCHNCGQMFIQKMLLPPTQRDDHFEYNEVETANDTVVGEIEDESADDTEDTGHDGADVSTPKKQQPVNEGSTIPETRLVYSPFLNRLCQLEESSRKDSLEWFADYFSISDEDKRLVYDSNSHLKWETCLDAVITVFRKNCLIENSAIGAFHVTELGRRVSELLQHGTKDLTDALAEAIKNEQPQDEDPDVTRATLPFSDDFVDPAIETETSEDQIADEVTVEKHAMRLSKRPLEQVRLLLGEDLRTHEKYYWEFGNKELNNRHLLINGNSGCGKTYCIQTLLMEAALQGVSSVVFDYTGGFANSKLDPTFKAALGGKIEQRIVKIKKIPVNPFAKHDIQIDDDIFVPEEDADVADKIAEIFKSVYSLGDQQRSAVYSAVLNGMRLHGSNMSFSAMVQELENNGSNYAKTVISKIQTFTDFNPFALDEVFNWTDIRDSDGMVYVFQLAGYGREIQVLLTEILLWDIWSFCVKNGDESKPFVIVLDEAQNLSHGEKSPSAKILTEGRKFGISGWYATQFMKPQLTDDEIQRLQQAGQKLYFCPPDDGVMTIARNIDITAQGAKEWSERLKKLKKGECVTCGNMVRNERWSKYEPKAIKVTSLQERLTND